MIQITGLTQYNTIQYNTVSLFPPYLKIVISNDHYQYKKVFVRSSSSLSMAGRP